MKTLANGTRQGYESQRFAGVTNFFFFFANTEEFLEDMCGWNTVGFQTNTLQNPEQKTNNQNF